MDFPEADVPLGNAIANGRQRSDCCPASKCSWELERQARNQQCTVTTRSLEAAPLSVSVTSEAATLYGNDFCSRRRYKAMEKTQDATESKGANFSAEEISKSI
jgi:hypothetical protein